LSIGFELQHLSPTLAVNRWSPHDGMVPPACKRDLSVSGNALTAYGSGRTRGFVALRNTRKCGHAERTRASRRGNESGAFRSILARGRDHAIASIVLGPVQRGIGLWHQGLDRDCAIVGGRRPNAVGGADRLAFNHGPGVFKCCPHTL